MIPNGSLLLLLCVQSKVKKNFIVHSKRRLSSIKKLTFILDTPKLVISVWAFTDILVILSVLSELSTVMTLSWLASTFLAYVPVLKKTLGKTPTNSKVTHAYRSLDVRKL